MGRQVGELLVNLFCLWMVEMSALLVSDTFDCCMEL
jgi:hypothetical protein